MKSPTSDPNGGQVNPEHPHPRPMSCRGSAMQRELALAVRNCHAIAPRYRQSDRVKRVIANDQPSCPVLEAVIDERITSGASEESILEIGNVVQRHIRQKLMHARPEYAAMVRDLDLAMIAETQAQGPQDVATVESFGSRCLTKLKNLLNRSNQQREALELVIVATEAEIAERERQYTTTVSRFNLSPRGRAS